MQLQRWDDAIKGRARELRKQNQSLGQISRSLKVPKSTLHAWISELKRPTYITKEDKLRHLRMIRPLAAQALRKQRETRLEKIRTRVEKEIKQYFLGDKKLLKAMLSMLYWTEGSKGRGYVQFTNTNPKLVLLFITLLRKAFSIDENKFRVRLHLHYYHKIKTTKRFWSSLLMISEARFGKIYIKPRSQTKRFRKNFAGICFLRYNNEDLRYELLQTAYTLGDRITGTRSSAD